jgi:hypothetical protein
MQPNPTQKDARTRPQSRIPDAYLVHVRLPAGAHFLSRRRKRTSRPGGDALSGRKHALLALLARLDSTSIKQERS